MAQTLTDVAVEVYPDLKRIKPAVTAAGKEAGEELGDGIVRGADGKLRDSRGKFVASGASVGKSTGKSFGKGLETGFGETFAKTAAVMASKFALIGGAAAAASPGVLQLAGALAPAVGAAAVLPAALLSIKAVSLTTKVAVMGVGDAISAGFGENAKQAEAALKGLSKNAQVAAKQIIGMKGSIDGLKTSVQDRLFLPLLNDIQPLADRYIPLLKAEMGDLAGVLGGVGEEISQTARQGVVMQAVRAVFDSTTNSVVRLRGAVEPLTIALANLILSTAPELPKLAVGFSAAATRAGEFVTTASQTGRVTAAFEKGKQVISDLGGILGNVGSIIVRVYSAANAGGNTLLGNLKNLTGQAADFLYTTKGFDGLAAIFSTLGSVGSALRTGLGAVLPAIADSLIVIGPALSGLAGPASQLVVAIAPLLPIVAGLTAQIVTALTPALSRLAGFLAENEQVVKGVAIALTVYAVALKATAAAAAVQAAGGLLAYAKATTIVSNVTKIATAIQYGFGVAMKFALGPIGLIITGITLLVAAIVYLWKNNQTFRDIVMKVWKAVQNAVSATVDWFRNTALPWLMKVWDGIAAGAKWMWEKVLKPTFAFIVAYWQNVLIPAAMFLWKKVISPVFNGISYVVKAVMAAVQLYIAVLVAYWKNVLAPAAMFLWKNVIMPAFNGIKAAVQFAIKIVTAILRDLISFVRGPLATVFTWWWKNIVTPAFNGVKSVVTTVWNFIRPIFEAIGKFVRDTLASAFKTGVNNIKNSWNKLQDVAKKPVEFVVNHVINPLVGGFNKIAGVFGTDKIEPIKGFATGGQIPGRPSLRDNMLAAVGDTGRILKVAAGEYVTNTKSTLANLPLLKRINSKRGRVTRDDIDPVLDGYERGGRIGDGIGDFFGSVKRGFEGVGNAVSHPGETLQKIASAALAKIPGNGGWRDLLVDMGKKLISGAKSLMGKTFGGGDIGGGSVLGGWRGMQALISQQFPGLNLISGARPGAVTLSGNRSYHSLGRAVDYPPSRPLASWIRSKFGAKTKELITPFQELNLHNGRPHQYTGAIWNQHNFAGGNAHVHWAAQNGGMVGRGSGLAQVARADFGSVTLKRGWNLIENATGKPEPLSSTADSEALAVLKAILGAVEGNPAAFARAMGGTTTGLLREARRR